MPENRITATSSIHILIGATGFEPATSRPPAVRATKLRHTPVKSIIAKVYRNVKKNFSNFQISNGEMQYKDLLYRNNHLLYNKK